jgi:hypothetical protein
MSDKLKVVGYPEEHGELMSDFIVLASESDSHGSVELSKNLGEDPPISNVLRELKRFLVAIGYDWVETVSVSATDSTGELIIHTSDDYNEVFHFDS